jgi:hypothetical protein
MRFSYPWKSKEGQVKFLVSGVQTPPGALQIGNNDASRARFLRRRQVDATVEAI